MIRKDRRRPPARGARANPDPTVDDGAQGVNPKAAGSERHRSAGEWWDEPAKTGAEGGAPPDKAGGGRRRYCKKGTMPGGRRPTTRQGACAGHSWSPYRKANRLARRYALMLEDRGAWETCTGPSAAW
jgi:hypothetical protein